MTEPTDDLQQRCAEVVEWQRTGVLPGDALRNYAAAHWAGRHDSLQMAERDTSAQAMQWIAKWGTPPVVAGEPFAWADDGSLRSGSTATAHRVVTHETKMGMPKAAADSFNTPLYTTPPAGAVPLTDEQSKALTQARSTAMQMAAEGRIPECGDFSAIAQNLDWLCNSFGIKGGQHGL